MYRKNSDSLYFVGCAKFAWYCQVVKWTAAIFFSYGGLNSVYFTMKGGRNPANMCKRRSICTRQQNTAKDGRTIRGRGGDLHIQIAGCLRVFSHKKVLSGSFCNALSQVMGSCLSVLKRKRYDGGKCKLVVTLRG